MTGGALGDRHRLVDLGGPARTLAIPVLLQLPLDAEAILVRLRRRQLVLLALELLLETDPLLLLAAGGLLLESNPIFSLELHLCLRVGAQLVHHGAGQRDHDGHRSDDRP